MTHKEYIYREAEKYVSNYNVEMSPDDLLQSLTNLTRYILKDQIKLVEGMKKESEFDNESASWFHDHGYNQALNTIKQSLQDQLAELDK